MFDQLQDLQVGREVAVRSAYGNNNCMFGYTVKRITPKTGIIVIVDAQGKEMRFGRDGREMDCGHSSYRARLVPNVDAAREEAAQKARAITAANSLREVQVHPRVGWEWGKDALLEEVARVEALLSKARAAAEAI